MYHAAVRPFPDQKPFTEEADPTAAKAVPAGYAPDFGWAVHHPNTVQNSRAPKDNSSESPTVFYDSYL